MPKVIYGVSPTSVVLRAKLMDSTATDGRGLTGLSFSATGLTISVIKNNAASGAPYLADLNTIEDISTLGTYETPTTAKCRFREVDSSYHKGLYEFQFANSVFSATDSVIISIAGASALSEADFEIQCKNLNSNLKSIDEQATNGNNATLNLKQLSIINNSGDAFEIESTTGYGIRSSGLYAGAKFEGTTDGSGIIIVANGVGNGITVGSVSGDGANIRSDYGMGTRLIGSSENGLLITGYNYGAKIEATNPVSGTAIYAIGTYIGALIEGQTYGLNCYSSGSGYGIYSSGEYAGARFEGLVDGSGIILTGNGTGNGLTVGSVSGDGANIRSDYGIGMRLVGDTKDISTREIDAIEIKTGQLQFSADGVNIYDIMSNLLAMANGKFIKYGNIITFYRQNNSTPAFTVSVTASERTRI